MAVRGPEDKAPDRQKEINVVIDCVHHFILNAPDGSEENRMATGVCKKCGDVSDELPNGYDHPTRIRNTGKGFQAVPDITISKKGTPWYW